MKNILVIGSLNIDYVAKVSHYPREGETLLAQELTLVPGGKGANQAFSIGKLGGEVTMLGAVGEDHQGQLLLENLCSSGVKTNCISTQKNFPTGMAIITVLPNGDNSILVFQGANACVTPDYIREHYDLLGSCDFVVLQLEIPLETVIYAAREGHRLGKKVILDPAPATNNLPEELFQFLYLIKPNETELSALVGHPYSPLTLREDALSLQKRGVKNVLVTLGKEGSYLLLEDGSDIYIDADTSVQVVDTTAAGDSYMAALLVALSNDNGLPKAAKFASRVSSIVVTRSGAQSSIPSLNELRALGIGSNS